MFDFTAIEQAEQRLADYEKTQQKWVRYWEDDYQRSKEPSALRQLRRTHLRLRRTAAARHALQAFLELKHREDNTPS